MKDAYYFSHDSNMWNDPKIIKVRRKHGIAGYGLVNRLNEMLRNEKDNRLGLDEDTLDDLIFDLNDSLINREILEDVILHFKLYEREDADDNEFGYFYSKRMRRNMEKMEMSKQKRANAGRLGGIATAKVKQTFSNAIPLKEKKVNKSKVKESNIKTQYAFEIFWNKYDLKLLKPDCELIWNGERKNKRGIKFDDTIRKSIMDHLNVYVKHTYKNGTYPSRKHPRTYLNNNSWEDEIVIAETTGDEYL